MIDHGQHLSDGEIVRNIDGELTATDAVRVEAYLAGCRICQERERELRDVTSEVAAFYRATALPPANSARARLETEMSRVAVRGQRLWQMAALLVLIATGAVSMHFTMRQRGSREVVLDIPNPFLTPGVAVLEPANQLCRQSLPKNKDVSSTLRHRVMEEYGLGDAPSRAYEVDYLITPALGGTDDVRNLWPHSYSHTAWNAKVKDALEDRLHDLVCEGKVDLPTAQREIAMNWIDAYRKYFHTDRPIGDQ